MNKRQTNVLRDIFLILHILTKSGILRLVHEATTKTCQCTKEKTAGVQTPASISDSSSERFKLLRNTSLPAGLIQRRQAYQTKQNLGRSPNRNVPTACNVQQTTQGAAHLSQNSVRHQVFLCRQPPPRLLVLVGHRSRWPSRSRL